MPAAAICQPAPMFRANLAHTGACALSSPDLTSPYFYDEMVSGVAKLFTMGSILSSPVVDKDVLYCGSADGALHALM